MFALEPTEVIEDEPWRIDARCADGTSALVDLFFSEQLDDILRAKAFCVECPVSLRCGLAISHTVDCVRSPFQRPRLPLRTPYQQHSCCQ